MDDSGELLKILIVSAYAAPHVGGVEVVVQQQARTLAGLGHKVTVVTSRCGGDSAKTEQVDGYTVIRITAWNGLESHKAIPLPLWGPEAAWRLPGLVGKSDIVHVHDVYHGSSILSGFLAKLFKRPFFLTQHVAIVEHDSLLVRRAQESLYSLVGRLLWRWARVITVYNPIVESFIRRHGVSPDKIRLTYNGIDVDHFKPDTTEKAKATRERFGLASGKPVVLFVGRLVPKKGANRIIEARGCEYEIALAGPGRIPDSIPAGVKFLGAVDRDDLRDLYQASDIFAFPAIGEMFTLVMQEAMACGLPIVATAEEAYSRYDIDRRGMALVSTEPDMLRQTFLEILDNPALKYYMQGYSRRLAEDKFDWKKNAEGLMADYRATRRRRRGLAAWHFGDRRRENPGSVGTAKPSVISSMWLSPRQAADAEASALSTQDSG